MGRKGDAMTSQSVMIAALLLEKLAAIKNISSKKMFGGHGIFHEGKMFGIIDSKGTAYFKVGETNQSDYEQHDSHKHGKMPYYSIPNSVLEDSHRLLNWAKKSIEISKG